jgi:hypothetical protein
MPHETKKRTGKGSTYLGRDYLGGRRGVAIEYPLQDKGYKIIFYNRLGEKQYEVSSEIEKSILLNASFELLTNGCGTFGLMLSEIPVEITGMIYGWRVDIYLYGDSNPWYSGYILKFPQSGSTKIVYEYEGFGFYNQLDDVYIQASHTNKQVSTIVDLLVRTIIEPYTDIVYHAANIQDTDYEIQSIRWDHVSAKDVMKELSELAGGFLFGVDEHRRFFFRAKDTSINENARFWVGKHLETFIPDADYDKIKNRLHIYAGIVTGGEGTKTNYIYTVNDNASQALYGIKAEKLTIPSALDNTDATQWGNYKLTEKKDPIQTAKVTGIEIFQKKIEAIGKMKVTSNDGLHEYELAMERVEYKIDSNIGIEVNVELGRKDISFTEEQLNFKKKLTIAEALADQRLLQS